MLFGVEPAAASAPIFGRSRDCPHEAGNRHEQEDRAPPPASATVTTSAPPTASLPPHEILLVIDGNTGQNALSQVKAFDDALGLTGLIVTKLDGTAKGGVLAAIARERPIPVYFIGVGEKLEDLETFNAREFAQALLA